MSTAGEDTLGAALVGAVSDAALAVEDAAGLRDAVAGALRRRLGWRRAVIPGDRLPSPVPSTEAEAVDLDIGVRGRLAGRMYAVVSCAWWEDDPVVLRDALLAAVAAVEIRALGGYVVVAAPSGAWAARGWPQLLAGGSPRAVAPLLAEDDTPSPLSGIPIPARVGARLVANAPVAARDGWTLRGFVTVSGGGEITL